MTGRLGRGGWCRVISAEAAEAVIAVLDPLRRRYADISADPAAVLAIARDGAARAQRLAAPRPARATTAIGLLAG